MGHRFPSCGPPVNKWQFTVIRVGLGWHDAHRRCSVLHSACAAVDDGPGRFCFSAAGYAGVLPGFCRVFNSVFLGSKKAVLPPRDVHESEPLFFGCPSNALLHRLQAPMSAWNHQKFFCCIIMEIFPGAFCLAGAFLPAFLAGAFLPAFLAVLATLARFRLRERRLLPRRQAS